MKSLALKFIYFASNYRKFLCGQFQNLTEMNSDCSP